MNSTSEPGLPGRPRAVTLFLLGTPLLLFLGVPVGLLVLRATPSLVAHELAARETRSALVLSFISSTATLLLAAVAGTPLACWLAHTRSRLRPIVETLIDLPTILPPSVAGVALLLAFGRAGPIGSLLHSMGVNIAFTPAAVVMAQLFVASPYYVRAARAGFASVGVDLREAATIDGATGWRLFRTVLAPLASPSLGAGAAMCWSRALGEFGATIIFAGNLPGVTQTMPVAVYLGFESGLDRALVLSTILIATSLLVLIVARVLAKRPAF